MNCNWRCCHCVSKTLPYNRGAENSTSWYNEQLICCKTRNTMQRPLSDICTVCHHTLSATQSTVVGGVSICRRVKVRTCLLILRHSSGCLHTPYVCMWHSTGTMHALFVIDAEAQTYHAFGSASVNGTLWSQNSFYKPSALVCKASCDNICITHINISTAVAFDTYVSKVSILNKTEFYFEATTPWSVPPKGGSPKHWICANRCIISLGSMHACSAHANLKNGCCNCCVAKRGVDLSRFCTYKHCSVSELFQLIALA